MTLTTNEIAMKLKTLHELDGWFERTIGFHRARLGGEKTAINLTRQQCAVIFARQLVEDTYPAAKAKYHEIKRAEEERELQRQDPGRELGEGLAEVRAAMIEAAVGG